MFNMMNYRDVLFEYHRAVVPFWAVDQLEVCLLPILVVFQNLRWNTNKTSLIILFKAFSLKSYSTEFAQLRSPSNLKVHKIKFAFMDFSGKLVKNIILWPI